MQSKIVGGVIFTFTLCVSLGIVIAVYAQQGTDSSSTAGSYQDQNEKLRESLRQGMERLQEKQEALMEWLQEGSQQIQTDQQQMDVMKQGLEQLESNRRYLEWLQQGILQLQEEQAYIDSLRQGIEDLNRTQEQTLQQWLDKEAQQAEATEMERKRTEDERLGVQQKLIEEAEQVKATELQLKRLRMERAEAEKKLLEETKQTEATELQLQRVQTERAEAEQKLAEEVKQAEAIDMQLQRMTTTRQESETKLVDETKQVEAAEMELQQMQAARLEAEQQRAEASKQAEEFEKMQAEIARLEMEQKEVQKWLKSDQPDPLGQLGAMPEVCSEHIQAAQQQFAEGGFTKELWLEHIFECQECCAPILTDVMDEHVAHVTDQPHTVVLFDFDRHAIKAKYEEELDTLMTTSFDSSQDKVLLIGRASKIGDRGYNIALSGKRAGEIRDYLVSRFSVPEELIRYQFFGFDPPQLTLEYAARYGISSADLSAVDNQVRLAAEKKINQSVVVVIYKGGAASEVLNASQGAGTNSNDSSSKN